MQTAAEAALAFVEAVIAGEDVRPFIVDIRGTFIGESIGFRGPYVPAPEIAEGVLAATRPFVGLRAEVTNAETLRVLEDGRLVEKPDRSGPGRPLGPGCALWGDIHIACSVRLHTAGSDGEFVVAMISRQAFRDLQGDRPLWLVDGFGVTIPLLPFTG